MSHRASRISHLRRLAGAAAAIVAVSGGVAACSSGGGGASSGTSLPSVGPSTTGSITVQVQTGGEKEFANFIAVFHQKYPHITVHTTSVSQTAKIGSNLTVLSSNNPPDVGIIPTNTQVYTRLLQAHQLVPLTDVFKADNLDSDYPGAVTATLESDGTPYVVNYQKVFYCVVYYNETIFKNLGIAVPANHRLSSISDLVSIVKTLKAHGYQGLAYGAADNYMSSWQIDSFLQGTTSSAQYANYMSSWQPSVSVSAPYTSSAFVNAVGAIKTLGSDGVYQDGYLGQKVTQAESLFLQQKAAMVLDGSWTPSQLQGEGLKFPIGWMLLPSLDPSKQTMLTSYDGDTLGIPANAKNIGLAKLFLESVMSEQGQASVISTGNLPAVTSVPSSAYSGLPALVQSELADAKANGSDVGWTSAVPGGLGQQFTDPLVQEMLNGQLTPTGLADKVQSQLMVTRSGQ